eukprot:jgi/Botrbrau1/6801/Bobra.0153s0004.1
MALSVGAPSAVANDVCKTQKVLSLRPTRRMNASKGDMQATVCASLPQPRWQPEHGRLARPHPTLLQKRQRLRGLSCRASAGEATTISGFKVTMTPEEARQWLRLIEIPNPDGPLSVIVVEAVAIGSRAQEEGVKPGQRVLAVTHPVDRDGMWELQPGALLSRVKDIFRVTRSPQVELVLSQDSVAEAWYEEQQRLAKEAQAASDQQIAATTPLQRALSSPLLNSLGGEEIVGSRDGGEEDALNVADQLERQFSKDLSEEQRAVQAYKRRIARRKERYEMEATRDDGPFFLFVFAFFAGPAAIILGIAVATGYLDTLQSRF